MLAKTPKKLGIKRKIAGGLTVVVLFTLATIPAKAAGLDVFSIIANSFGYGELYSSAEGLFASASELTQSFQAAGQTLATAVSTGELGMIDINKLGGELLKDFAGTPQNPEQPPNPELEMQRTKAIVAAKISGAPLTLTGQEKSKKQLEQQAKFAQAANDGAQETDAADNSLDAIKGNTKTTNAVSQQLAGIANMQIQNNSIAAGNSQIAAAQHTEATKVTSMMENAEKDNTKMLGQSNNFEFPLFSDGK